MASDKSKRNTSNEIKVPDIQLPISKPSLSVDVDYYQSIIDDPEVSDERKRELIEIVGAIVMNFIDIGFGVHPVQLARQQQQPPNIPQSEKEKPSERSDA